MDREKIKKVSVVFAVRDRPYALKNALYSMNRQETDLPVEFCIFNDASKESPEPIIKEFLTNFDYKFGSSKKQLDVYGAVPSALELASPESNVIILTCSDVIWTDKNTIDTLCEHVGDKHVSFANVINTPIQVDFYEEFDINAGDILSHWDDYNNHHWSIKMQGKVFHNVWNLKSGPARDSWIFYLGAILKKDILSTGIQHHWCDAIFDQKTRKVRATEGWDATYTGLRAIHQQHNKSFHYCSKVKTCPYDCVKKQEKWKV